MCGIVACRVVGEAPSYLFQALDALEYRGYDSVGIAVCTTEGGSISVRSVNRLADLAGRVRTLKRADLTGVGIGHTRWATNGGISEANAHPHADCSGSIQVVHNGIIENAETLRKELESSGHRFSSEVDSEVIAHLIESSLAAGIDLADALSAAMERCEGASAMVVMHAPTQRILGATRSAPLVVSSSPNGAFFASDVSAIAPWIDSFQVLRAGDIVELGAPVIWRRADSAPPDAIAHAWSGDELGLGGYPDHMGKEIDEQPELAGRVLDRLIVPASSGALWRSLSLPAFDRVAILGCGTSLNAAAVIAAAFRRFGGIPADTIVASEAAQTIVDKRTLLIAISQSGETADLLLALEGPNLTGCPVLAITNNPHSSLARRASAVVECEAGHEVGVAATKTFVAQVLTGVAVAISGLLATDRVDRRMATTALTGLDTLPLLLGRALSISKEIVPGLALEMAHATGTIFLGRESGVAYAAEGALKLKELTYRWAEHYPAGELKHGPLALVESGTPVIVIDTGGSRLAANMMEVRARGARLITIGGAGSVIPVLERSLFRPDDGVHPCGPLESVVPMQVLARELALVLGRDVDKPRNLAKSVTVA
jgi:glucosamine--fructose-6-phosphate aminotransferase (isomerizing)